MFHSKRISLRKMTKEDVEIYHSWRNNFDVMFSTNPSLDVYSLQETEEFVDSVILSSKMLKNYMIHHQKDDQTIGITSLINIDLINRNAECIIDIGEKDYWGKGYATEALQLLLDYAFLEMNLHRVSLRVFSFNERAIHLYDKMGFKQEGVAREALFRQGTWHDIIHMAILQNDYLSEYSRH